VKARIGAYGIALVVTAGAILLRLLLDPILGDTLPLVTLFGAVAAAVWFGGYGPAAVPTVLGYVACAFLFIEPRGALGLNLSRNLIGFIAYLITCAIIVALGETARRGRSRLSVNLAERNRMHEALLAHEQELRDIGRRKDEFLALLAHELRNPLAPIRNSLAILNTADSGGDKSRLAREMMGRSARSDGTVDRRSHGREPHDTRHAGTPT
jgi:K+-sensing histidine kinase KdpD